MRLRRWHQVDDASLQTDVMRFMAIVAFCLIAILAMVRNVEPVARQPDDSRPVVPDIASAPPTAAPPEIVPAAEIPAPAEPKPIAPQMAVDPQAPTPKPETTIRTVLEQPAEAEPARAATESPAQPDATASAEPANAPGLTLRFSSEGDFLRLVARGKVAVYAFDTSAFLSLDPNYQFQPTAPPEHVYELEPGTIPAHMSAALPSDAAHHQYKWAVGLPNRVERQIEGYLQSVDSGELLINKYEEVRHVPSR